jgi:hypothetical protein
MSRDITMCYSSKDGFVPISVKPAIGATRLAHDLV